GHQYAQTAAFLALIVVQWGNALNMNFEFKSWVYNFIQPNYKLLIAIGASILINVAVFNTGIKDFFGLAVLESNDALLAILFPTAASLLISDMHKIISGRLHVRRLKLDKKNA